ncbi:GerAB/ArcD/ProY family transporter [Alkalihalophilus lindianensis]|uniref:GerAB/ArcD/ProY family transporter n=1 Tax=Alkalihalophilus lindianensis TaxID=1630542 RepID=A0ABU3XF07_9BACI|nr:GerAB/ArcD/ProY family transporter [Alkalihalophilus lindianensis]MDV2686476.1 GerAB/ArcD/ProY family transporter [Alkalihalophilus lindianensis]
MKSSHVRLSDTLTTYQLAVCLISTMLGVGLLNLPRALTTHLDTADGWISALIAGIGMCLIYLFTMYAFKKHHVSSIDEYMNQAFGVIISKIINTAIAFYFLVLCGWQAVAMSEMVRFFLLEQTPYYLIICSIIVLCAYATYYSLATIVRVACFFFPISVIVLVFVLGLGAKDASLYNIRPVAPEGLWPIIMNLPYALQPFQGIELIFILMASVQKKAKMTKAGIGALFFVTALYAITYVVVVSVLGVVEVQTVLWPTIDLTHAADSTLLFTERVDTFLITTWTLQFFLTSVFSLYAAIFLLNKTFPVRRGYLIIGATIVTCTIAVIPQTTDQISAVSDWQQYAFVTIFILLPILCYLMVMIRRKVKT